MDPIDRDPADAGWCTASDLAEYAYCPRAHFYRHHPPPGGIDPESARSQHVGTRYHARRSMAMETREQHAGRWIAALALAIGLLWLAVYWGVGL
ncbi:MAG: hypothetical protein L3K19_06875 [Thermoplasmata archaeon]|nr:hypothetical protein [Thermoplasmata archaeon]